MEHHDPSEGAASADQDGYEELDSQIQKQIEDLTLEEEEEEELEELEELEDEELEDDEEDFINREEEREDKTPAHACSFCGISNPACVARCKKTN